MTLLFSNFRLSLWYLQLNFPEVIPRSRSPPGRLGSIRQERGDHKHSCLHRKRWGKGEEDLQAGRWRDMGKSRIYLAVW